MPKLDIVAVVDRLAALSSPSGMASTPRYGLEILKATHPRRDLRRAVAAEPAATAELAERVKRCY